MSIVPVPLSDEDLTFLRAYSEAHGTSVEAFLAGQAHNLRERLEGPLGSEVAAASGIIAADIDAKAVFRRNQESKHF